jgi:L-lysine 6-transaminase
MDALREKYPDVVSNTRGQGLMTAFDLPDGEMRGAVLGKARDNGMIVVGCGDRSVRFRPPLNLTAEEADEGVDIIDRSIGQVVG